MAMSILDVRFLWQSFGTACLGTREKIRGLTGPVCTGASIQKYVLTCSFTVQHTRGKGVSMKNNTRPKIAKLIRLLTVTGCLALGSAAQAVDPPPDGGYPGRNTAEGENALLNLTRGNSNTAVGYHALTNVTLGGYNT